jgi:hypothetical protein
LNRRHRSSRAELSLAVRRHHEDHSNHGWQQEP